MKKTIQEIQLIYKNYSIVFFIIILFLISSNNIIAQQWSNSITFDTAFSNLYIDTLQTNNSWQIGTPNKVLFDSARTRPNAIVTDTVNYYPINDTSSFVLKINRPTDAPFWVEWVPYISGPTPFVSFMSKIDTDSLSDIGYVEYSLDNGTNWLPVNEYFFVGDYHPPYYGPGTPFFTSTWNGWFETFIYLGDSNPDPGIETVDSVLFKFTFVSDGINTNKEGWIIDDIRFGTIALVGVNDIEENNNFNIYPNPVNNEFTITATETGKIYFQLKIYNILGEMVSQSIIENPKSQINISDLPKGVYFVKLISVTQILTKKIIKE
ncbi:MAG: T9SS type A sorting domain-containing protein [Bacteroidia bacterium]|nr:T9SS type A sorting domain-containing protein [Bacteroidia bacterium]